MVMKKALLMLILLPAMLCARLSSLEAGGYVKYLFSSTKYPLLSNRLNDHLIHARLNTRWYPAEPLMAALEIRFRGYYGGSVENIPGFSDQVKSQHEFVQLDAFLWEKKKTLGYGEVDRMWLDYSAGNWEVTLGRQRIAWGTALVWNVIDLFNPQSILDFDYEEKPGADALRVQYYTGPVSRVEVSVKPGKSKRGTTVAGLWLLNAREYDFYLIGGIRNNRWVVGGAWAGQISDAGFRGEFLFSQAPDKGAPERYPDLSPYGTSFFRYDKPVFSGVLSADYTFPNSLYLHSELLFNSNGKIRNAGIFYREALQVGMLSPARWSLFQEVGYDITPLLRGSVFGIFNPDDHSAVVLPYFTYSVITNLDLMVLGFVTSGKSGSEYGDFGNSVFVRLKYSF